MADEGKTTKILTTLASAITFLSYSVLLAKKDFVAPLAAREALLEYIGALCFLLASCLSLALYVRARRVTSSDQRTQRLAFLALAIFFFVAFGEEVSWGTLGLSRHQRARLFPNNVQKELNLHNLEIFDEYENPGQRKRGWERFLTANRLFDYFMITSFILVPAACRFYPSFRKWLATRGIPCLPGLFALALTTNMALTVVSEVLLVDSDFMHGAVSEIREFNYAILCLFAVAYLFLTFAHTSSDVRHPA